MKLVSELIDWVHREYDSAVVLADTSIYPCTDRPPRIGAHVPDLFAWVDQPTRMVLGEAKTRLDMENEHTKSQLRAFLTYCNLHPGSHFIIAVPWDMSRLANNLILQIISERELYTVSFSVKGCYVN